MLLLWSNCTQPGVELDGLYVLLSVTTATLSFFLNLLQMIVIVYQNLLRSHKNLVVLHLCLCGQLSCAPVLCALIAPSSPPLAPALHLLALFTFAPLITLLVLQQHPLGRPRAMGLLLLLAWCQALLISLVPLTEWYGAGPMPPASFAALVCVLYFLHYPLVLILLVDLCIKRSNRVGIALDVESLGRQMERPLKLDSPKCLSKIVQETEHTRIAPVMSVIPSRGQVRNDALLVGLWAACTLPFFCHTAFAARDLCGALAANERASLWTSWMTMMFAAVRPVFHAHLEEDLAEGTVSFINAVFRVKE